MSARSPERVFDAHTSERSAVLKIFAEEARTPPRSRRLDDERVPQRDVMFAHERDRGADRHRADEDDAERAEVDDLFFRRVDGERDTELLCRRDEELLKDLG